MHAIIIEEDTWTSLQIEDTLRDIGYTSFEFPRTTAEAAASAQHRRPDLITSGARLDGSSCIDSVDAICRNGNIPVVFVTATANEVRGRADDPTAIQKPFAPFALKRAVEIVTAGHESPGA